MNDILLNSLLLLATILTFLMLYRRGQREGAIWRATVTPLASIIGSGFLIVTPLLDKVVGVWAPLFILFIVVLAYAIGSIVRYNIRYLEPQLASAKPPGKVLSWLTDAADLALSLAYVISVTFYLRLLASFLLRAVELEDEMLADIITTAILAFIGIVGALRGLRSLEELEKYAVYVNLSIIAALMLGLLWFDGNWMFAGGKALHVTVIHDWPETMRILAGVLIIVQGFETSRYMGDSYDRETRIRTMRYAQWLSGLIYLVFVSLAMPLFSGYHGTVNETAIIDLAARVAASLSALLILTAMMSQFSAAVADTIGAGGLIQEGSQQRVRPHQAYALVTVLAIGLVWSTNIFEIIALASRAFALYYLLQTLIALVVATRRRAVVWLRLVQLLMAGILLYVVLFAVPAG